MDITEELNLSPEFLSSFENQPYLDTPKNLDLKTKAADHRNNAQRIAFVQDGLTSVQVKLQQIKVTPGHSLAKSNEKELFTKVKPSINYSKAFENFNVFFTKNPLVSLTNFQVAKTLFTNYFSSKRELLIRLFQFKKNMENFSHEQDKFGKLSFDFKIKDDSVQITLQRSRLKGIKQYLSISTNPDKEFLSFTQWNWKHKKEELIRSRSLYKKKNHTDSSIDFDAKVWRAFNNQGLRRKHFMKSLDCIERNQERIIDFINLANKKNILHLIEPDLFNNVSIKTDNQDTLFMNFRSNLSQKVDLKLTKFASSIVVAS